MAREIEVTIGCERVSDVLADGIDSVFNLVPQTTVFIKQRAGCQLANFTFEVLGELEDNGSRTEGASHACCESTERSLSDSMT